jgi:hypothetical protein
LPSYTIQATADELSLGIGKRRRDRDDASESLIDRTSTIERPLSTVTTNIDTSEAPATEPVSLSPLETLPPYIPPPTPALVANETGRMRAPVITQNAGPNSRPGSRGSS